MKAKWLAGGSIEHRPEDSKGHAGFADRPDDQ